MKEFSFIADMPGTHTKGEFLDKSARFSACRRYRFELWRRWKEDGDYVMFIGLNPSTADENNDDPTIRRCVNFAKDLGYSGLCMMNLFALRTPNPLVMRADKEPVGGDMNDVSLMARAKAAGLVIAAWGVHGTHLGRDKAVKRLIRNLHCLGITADGHPRHPLYLKKTTKPVSYS